MAAALALVAGDTLDATHRTALLGPMSKALPGLTDSTA